MTKIWKLKPEIPQEAAEKLSSYPTLARQLLYNRELTNDADIQNFLNPEYANLHNPFLFKDMEKAVNRIWQAIENKEKITVYGDYDADAVTANAVLQQTFIYIGHTNINSYIPDRFAEGYGVNLEAMEKIRQSGTKLVITVDCGTNSVDAADFCASNGMDFIITDHHEIIGEKPKALALINPKNPDDAYPYSEITGVGVAFKLATALLQDARTKNKVPNYTEGFEKWLLDLVATGTVADCHSLLGENRILVKFGLKVLAKTRWPGMRALINSSGLDLSKKNPDTYTLGFVVAPRLNAAGRLEHADIALNLLLEQNSQDAQIKAEELELINKRRQQLTQNVMSEAKEKLTVIQERKVLALVGEGWPKGVMGLVAGRLAEEFYKPVIVLERTENLCTGSARTAGEFNLIEALKFSSEHLDKFGGHKQAAGLSLQAGNFEFFYQKVLEFAELNIVSEKSERVLELEAELSESELSISTCQLLQKFEPFGVNNTKPKFLVSNMVIKTAKSVGATAQHTQYLLQKGNRTISAIAFNSAVFEKIFKIGDIVDVAGELMEDSWNGNTTLKLRIIDLRHASNSAR